VTRAEADGSLKPLLRQADHVRYSCHLLVQNHTFERTCVEQTGDAQSRGRPATRVGIHTICFLRTSACDCTCKSKGNAGFHIDHFGGLLSGLAAKIET
jgi:hypothetical protein